MDRLVILSDDFDSAKAYAELELGLSDSRYRVINEASTVLIGHPVSVRHNISTEQLWKIDEHLSRIGTHFTRDSLQRFLKSLDELFSTVNSLYSKFIYKGRHELTTRLESCGFTCPRGFKFQIGFNSRMNYYFIHPESDNMQIIVNLYLGYKRITALNQPKFSGVEINDPKGYFNQKSIKYDL